MLLIRHAESVWNATGRWQGQADPPLSSRGRRAVAGLVDRIRPLGITRIVASDLIRAAETAALLGAALEIEPRLITELREWNVGAWSGLSLDEIERRFPSDLARVRSNDLEVRPGGGESRRELQKRVSACLSRLVSDEHAGCTAVVTHGGAIRSIYPDVRLANLEFVLHPPS